MMTSTLRAYKIFTATLDYAKTSKMKKEKK